MDFVEQLKSSVQIESVIGEYVRLRKSGASRYVGLCPFHNEKSGSFTVHAAKQFYYCFGCHAKGDVVNFVMEMEHISFYEALKSLAERYGIPMPKRSQYADEDSKLRGAIYQMHELAQEAFRANLNGSAGSRASECAEAQAYTARRGLAPETVEQFGLGYSDRSGRALLRLFESQFTAAQMEQSGLVGKRQDGTFYDRFRNRLMFPIQNESGKIIGFGGRALSSDDEPKYLNSPETAIYKKSQVLYNLHRAKEAVRKDDRVILVEGYMDAIGVSAAGFRAVVASCGTALTTQQVQTLKRHSQKIVVNFDPDAAGATAAERSIGILLEEGMQVRIMELDGDLDPDEYCKEHGGEAYRQRLETAKGYFFWLADRLRSRHDMRTTEGKVAVLKALLPAVHRIADALERSVIANELAGYLGVDKGMVLDSFRRTATDRQESTLARPAVILRPDERMLLSAVFGDDELRDEVIQELRSVQSISGFASRRIFQAVFALADTGKRVSFDEVNARLEEADQHLLAEAVLRGDAEQSPEEVAAALKRVRLSDHQQETDQLRARIKELEREGKREQALQLMAGLPRLSPAARERR
jgi:DNA primase